MTLGYIIITIRNELDVVFWYSGIACDSCAIIGAVFRGKRVSLNALRLTTED